MAYSGFLYLRSTDLPSIGKCCKNVSKFSASSHLEDLHLVAIAASLALHFDFPMLLS